MLQPLSGLSSSSFCYSTSFRFLYSSFASSFSASHSLRFQSTMSAWHPLTKDFEELRLSVTLPSGQAFRWRIISNVKRDEEVQKEKEEDLEGEWIGIIQHQIVRLRQKESQQEPVHFYYNQNSSSSHVLTLDEYREFLHDYFRLSFSLADLFAIWRGEQQSLISYPSSTSTSTTIHKLNQDFGKVSPAFRGLRLLRQDPEECLFSFICSQNNNIARITKMIDSLCKRYGDPISLNRTFVGGLTLSQFEDSLLSPNAFPTLQQLQKATETELRDLGFGYRAKFICKSAEQVALNNINYPSSSWLLSLRSSSSPASSSPSTPRHFREELTALMGVGNKVADCVALCSLDKLDTIPVDTHVWQIAQRYLGKNVLGNGRGPTSPGAYETVANFFRKHFGDQCGWAHTILFAAELKQFQKREKGEGKKNKKEKEEEVEKDLEEKGTKKRGAKTASTKKRRRTA